MNKKIIIMLIAFIIGTRFTNALVIPATTSMNCSLVGSAMNCEISATMKETASLSGYDIWYMDFKCESESNNLELVSNSNYAIVSNIRRLNNGGVFRVDYNGDVEKDQTLTLFTLRITLGATQTEAGTYLPSTILMGDWDADNEVGPTDVVNYRKYLANDSAVTEIYEALSPANQYALDLKFDNEINLVDLVQARLLVAE